MAAILTLHPGGRHHESSGRPPTGDEVLREAAQLAVDYARTQLGRIAEDDPDRERVEALANVGRDGV